jgi:hypothetical protein
MTGFNRSMAQVGYAAPWRGAGTDWPTATGSGAANVVANIPGAGVLNSPVGETNSTWHPTIIYLIIFVIGEMLVFHFLSDHLGL